MGLLSIFKSRKKREQKRKEKELAQMCANFKSLDQLEKSGMMLWQQDKRRLFLEQTLAQLMMVSDEKWKSFLKNVFTWVYYNECVDNMNAMIVDEQLKAVRRAKKKCNTLTMRDINRIKSAKKQEIPYEAFEKQAPEVQPFEFFVIHQDSEAIPVSKNHGGKGEDTEGMIPGGRVLCVGQYDPDADNFDIATWAEVKAFLEQNTTEKDS